MTFLCLLSTTAAVAQTPGSASEQTRSQTSASATESNGAAAREAAYQFALAKMLAEESSFREAQRAFERALELDASDPYSYLEVAGFHNDMAYLSRSADRRRQQLTKAAEYAAGALALAPENRDVLQLYAQIHFRLGEHQLAALNTAQEVYEKLRSMTEGDLQVLSSLGQIYLWKRQPEKAAEVLEEAASYLPNHRMIQTMLVDALFESGDAVRAEKALARLVAIDPSSLDNLRKLAELRAENGDHQGAVEALTSAPPELLEDARLRRLLARELHLSGDTDAALALTDEMAAELPEDDGVKRLRVAILTSLTRYRDAITELRQLVDGDAAPARKLQDSVLLARLLERVGEPDEALARLRGQLATSSGEESLQLKLTLAGVLERSGKADEAVDMLRSEVGEVAPEPLSVYARALAEILDRGDRVDEAVRLLDETAEKLRAAGQETAVLDLELRKLGILAGRERWREVAEWTPELFDREDADLRLAARRLHAQALAETGRLEEGLALLDAMQAEAGEDRRVVAKRVEILFDHGRAAEAAALLDDTTASERAEDLFFAARLYQQAERYDRVVPLMERLLEEQPESPQALFLLAAAHERSGTRGESVTTFKRLLEVAPDHAPSLNYLGYMWAERGENLSEALDLILRAVEIDPDNGAYVDSLGWVYFQLGRYEQARQHLEWAARLLPTDPTIFEHLGDVYRQLEEPVRARDFYRQALELEGDNVDEVRRKLETLGEKGL